MQLFPNCTCTEPVIAFLFIQSDEDKMISIARAIIPSNPCDYLYIKCVEPVHVQVGASQQFYLLLMELSDEALQARKARLKD